MKELVRILSLISKERILEQDCLPEKHRIIDDVHKLKNVPKKPSSVLTFTQADFKSSFRDYFEMASSRAKVVRKLRE